LNRRKFVNLFDEVILTRFTRVTFHAAHQYLGLTTEVLRTEKAINELACHPLPASFYEGGGLQHLRQRFDDGFPIDQPEKEEDYFSRPAQRTTSPVHKSLRTVVLSKEALVNSPVSSHPPSLRQHHARRHQVQAGDLHSTAGNQGDLTRGPLTRSFSILNSPRMTRSMSSDSDEDQAHGTSGDDFNLRDEVMSCIAKSIGLQQPPLSGVETPEASPAILPFDSPKSRNGKQFSASSFGSLSLLDIGDDGSSITGGTNSALSGHGDAASGFDNEVEILFYSAGSILAKAGERNKGEYRLFLATASQNLAHYGILGLFYVIEGFLDVLLPVSDQRKDTSATHQRHDEESPTFISANNSSGPQPSKKLLFTVKPGGIAGYLGNCLLR
jgi:lysophospholipid hydrolase